MDINPLDAVELCQSQGCRRQSMNSRSPHRAGVCGPHAWDTLTDLGRWQVYDLDGELLAEYPQYGPSMALALRRSKPISSRCSFRANRKYSRLTKILRSSAPRRGAMFIARVSKGKLQPR